MIETAELRAMPTSLNDACRKMELAADCIDLLRLRVSSAEGEVSSLKEFIDRYGRQAACPDVENDVNDFAARGEHMPGVTK